MENRGQTFLPACFQFCTFNLLFVLLGYSILRWGYKRLKKYKISKLLRPFSLGVYLTPLLLDGNLQYFCFLMFSQITLGFSLNPRDKILNVVNYMIYFFVVWFSVVSSFLAYWMSRRLAKYILDNWKTKIYGLLSYSLVNAVRMIALGAIHSLMRSHSFQLPLLLIIQTFYVLFFIFSMNYWKAHRVSFKIWFTVVFSLLRIALQTVLILQQKGELVGSGS